MRSLRPRLASSCLLFALLVAREAHGGPPPVPADIALDNALQMLVRMPGGPPGAIALVQRGNELRVHAAGSADVAIPQVRPAAGDAMRIASTSKAFSGAVALSLVSDSILSLDDSIGFRLSSLPVAWHAVTLRQLLQHTSGIPDFTASQGFIQAVVASFGTAPPPEQLLGFVASEPLLFSPGSEFRYSNSDNIAVGLMVEAATGNSYEDELAARVTTPLGLATTTLPAGTAIPSPYIHGYNVDGNAVEDVSLLLAAGWAWASGGILSTPAELNTFIRAYVGGALFSAAVQEQQLQLVPGGSEPNGPGRNDAGLALFRYETRCGTVYGHTGNTFGYTQFMAATLDGSRSATVSVSFQRTQRSAGHDHAAFLAMQRAQQLAVCAALAP